MKKINLIAVIVFGIAMIVSAVFVSANIATSESEIVEEEITIVSSATCSGADSCGSECGGSCGGECGVQSCGCGK